MEFPTRVWREPIIRCSWCSTPNDAPDDINTYPEIPCVYCGYMINVPAVLTEVPEDQRLRDLGAPTLPGLE